MTPCTSGADAPDAADSSRRSCTARARPASAAGAAVRSEDVRSSTPPPGSCVPTADKATTTGPEATSTSSRNGVSTASRTSSGCGCRCGSTSITLPSAAKASRSAQYLAPVPRATTSIAGATPAREGGRAGSGSWIGSYHRPSSSLRADGRGAIGRNCTRASSSTTAPAGSASTMSATRPASPGRGVCRVTRASTSCGTGPNWRTEATAAGTIACRSPSPTATQEATHCRAASSTPGCT